jgi:tetratricopeptide (TPR) repeat protein
VLLTFLIGILALLLASSVARNSDLWMHLAKGRRLVQSAHPFGTDSPLASGITGSQSWLYDLVCYGLYSKFGGAGLVLGKALVVVALAVLLLRLSRSGLGEWVPVFCTALALLAMSVRLLLQPATLSYFFLALVLWFVWKRGAANRSSALFPPWPLLVLFVVWVNVDGWFLLGLGVAALVWLGQVLDEVGAGEPRGAWRVSLLRRGFWFALLTGVCLFNPAHVFAFVPSPELGFFGDAGASTSPFQRTYYANVGLNPASLAYFPLLGLSLFSFLLWSFGGSFRWSWQRFLPWLGLALLSAFQGRAIPFFAVVAGPVLAWNVQDFLDRGFDAGRWQTPAWRRGIVFGQGLTLMFLLVCLVCAWPGWLQSPPFEPRRWTVEIPPSLERGAAAVRDLLRESKLGSEARGLYLSRETAYPFAWFCPEEKGVQDPKLASVIRGDSEATAAWGKRMRAANINHVIVFDRDRSRFFGTVGKLLDDPRQWPLLHVEGDLVVFGWRDPSAGGVDPFRGVELDLNHLAYHPAEDKKAPDRPSANEPEARQWWEAFWKPVPPRPVDQGEATLHATHAEVVRRSAPWRHAVAWESCQFTACVGAAGGWSGPVSLLDAHLRLTLLRPPTAEQGRRFQTLPVFDQMAYGWWMRFARARDDTSPALLYLAVRAARRALAVNPNDAQIHLVLGESYLGLLHDTRERVWGERMPELVQLRRSQASAALNQAVALKPDFAQAHLSLSNLYAEMNCLDLMLHHLRTYVKLLHESGPMPGVSGEQFRAQEAAYQEKVNQLAKEVAKREDQFTVASGGWKVGDRALKASQEGLGGKARDLLLESDVAAFGPKGMALEVELLLKTGRAKDVRDWLGSDQKTVLGPSYHWLRAQALAALGNYASAREECDELSALMAQADSIREPAQFRELMALLIGQKKLYDQSGATCLPDLLVRTGYHFVFHKRIADFAQALRKEADLSVLRGLLALEEGDADEAEIAFRTALSVWKNAEAANAGGGLDFSGRVIAQDCLKWLE